MKWGVRRFQNPDGTLTDAGKKRYLDSNGSLNEKGKKYLDVEAYDNIKNGVLTMKNADLLTLSSPARGMSDREKDTATLGLKALNKMDRDTGEIDDNNREWFLYEDQTIGLPLVADLCAQGKTKSQIQALAKEASEHMEEHWDEDDFGFYYELAEVSGVPEVNRFIDACQEVMKDPNWKK